jgi:N-carbamoylputrescine amidase
MTPKKPIDAPGLQPQEQPVTEERPSWSCRVGLIQMPCAEDPADNLTRCVAHIREAAQRGAQIICTQELFRTRYFCQSEEHLFFDLAEPIPGPTTEMLGAVASEFKVTVIASLFERRTAGIYHNSAAVIGPDGALRGLYRKMHVPDDPLYCEKFYFTPGDTGFCVWPTPRARVGVLVCWDQWFPEGARLAALRGAQILFYPTAIGWHADEKAEWGVSQHGAWETMQRSHAIANGVYVCAANRVGIEGTVEFFGQSFIADPYGRVIRRASTDGEEVLVEDLDLGLIEEARRHWPFLRDRRIDAYGDLDQRFAE